MPRGEQNAKLSADQIDEIVRRYTTRLPDSTWEGSTTLARDFGVRHGTIQRWLRLRGVVLRSAKEAHSGGKRCKPVKNLPPEGAQGPPCKCATPSVSDAPLCKCDCGEVVAWNRRKNRWNAYVAGHYRPDAPYKHEDWLRQEYVVNGRSLAEMARGCGVTETTICKFLEKFGIPRQPVDHAKKGSPGARNAAWKGGVSRWEYSSDWKALARKIRNRDKWTCQDCGEQRRRWGIYLHVHHIDGNKLNNNESNLISLCATCHRCRHAAGSLREIETRAAA